MKKRELTQEELRECDALKRIYESKKRALGISQQTIADSLEITQGGVGHYLNGKNALNLRVAGHFSKALEISIKDFSPRLAREAAKVSEAPSAYAVESPVFSIPLISQVSAGVWCESPDEFQPGDAEEWLPRPKNAGDRTFALAVDGDSMTSQIPGQRSYPHGTIIYVDPDKPYSNGSRVVGRANGNYTFKLFVEDAGRKYLKPINPTYDKIDITDDVHICGVVIGSYLPE